MRLRVGGHSMQLAYDLPDHVLMVVRSYVLDFDGTEFVFLSPAAARRRPPPKRRHFNSDQKRALRVATLHDFVRGYGRKAQKRIEPNDRGYSRDVEQRVKRMKPAELDRLLRDDED